MKSYEVELRALLTEEKYQELKKFFDEQAVGEIDDADTYTFLTSELNIKVKNQTSKGKAKITVKKGAECKNSVDETELVIDPSEVDNAVKLITALGFENNIPSLQKRINYQIGEITVSLKHETNWKYHIEAEVIVHTEAEVVEAKKKLEKFFAELHLTPMTEKQTQDLINSIVIRYGMNEI